MRILLVLALSSCTLVGAGTGALIGNVAGNPGEGALIGGAIGLRVDLSIAKDLDGMIHKLIFW